MDAFTYALYGYECGLVFDTSAGWLNFQIDVSDGARISAASVREIVKKFVQ